MLNARKKDIHDRIYKFVIKVLEEINKLPATPENLILRKQCARSVTSTGANAVEADGAESKRDFIHKFTISKKESKETLYWLNVISDHNSQSKLKFLSLIKENQEIIAIISKIIINSKKNK